MERERSEPHPGAPWEIAKQALLLGAIRKYSYLLNGKEASLIGSVKHLTDLVAEIREHLFHEGYCQYLERASGRLSRLCIERKLIKMEEDRT